MAIGAIWGNIWDELIWNNAIWDDGVTDQTPDAFSFTGQVNVALATVITSNTITVTGLGVSVDCSFVEVGHTSGEYSLNGGGWTDLATFTISNGDTLALRLTTSANFVEQEDIQVTIGLVSDTWTVVTAGEPLILGTAINGTQLFMNFNTPITIGAGGNGGVTTTLSGGAATATYVSGDGTASFTYVLSRSIDATETGTITYTQPGNGFEDALGSDIATVAGIAAGIGGGVGTFQVNDFTTRF